MIEVLYLNFEALSIQYFVSSCNVSLTSKEVVVSIVALVEECFVDNH